MVLKTAIGIVILIFAFVYFSKTEIGSKFIDYAKGFLTSIIESFSKGEIKTGNTSFEIFLESKNSLQSFNIEASDINVLATSDNVKGFEAKGIKLSSGKSNETAFNVSVKKAFIVWKDDGSLKIFGSVYRLIVNDIEFSSDTGFEANIEMYPKTFLLSNIYSKELLMIKSFGNLSTEKGFLKLNGDEVRLRNFKGNIELTKYGLKIGGYISKILINNKEADILT